MAGQALKRLMTEYKELTMHPPEGIVAGPISEDNFFEWEAFILGPEGTCFQGGVFVARLYFPPDYPLSPPKMKFITEIFHPNSKYFKTSPASRFLIFILQFMLMVLFVFQFSMLQEMTLWATKSPRKDGVRCKVLKKFFSQ